MPYRSAFRKVCFLWICIALVLCTKYVSGTAIVTSSPSGLTKLQSRHDCPSGNHIAILSWVVKVKFDPRRDSQDYINQVADTVARNSDLVNRGQIGSLRGHYLFDHTLHNDYFSSNTLLTRLNMSKDNRLMEKMMPDHWGVKEISPEEWQGYELHVKDHLENHGSVKWYIQQHAYWRGKRSLALTDPVYPKQWHLHNTKHLGQDINILRVWERNITGKGVVAAVVDDGLEWTNPDLIENYYPEASYDLNDHDSDPMPSTKDKKNHHGTRCAGEIAAAANDVCGVGVAYHSRIAGLKVLDGPMTDSLEGVAFTKGKDLIDVYSCSWGPDDDGKTVDGPHYIALKALKEAVEYGRKGYGSIFVVASGNGGTVGDNCNFDGYANSIYTVTIGAVDELGAMPYYAEECASMLAVTFSSGSGNMRSIVTTDWRQVGGTGCTERHTGTSAAAPLAAGMVALMLQARPCLTWRDIQHIIVMAAVKVDVDVAHWTRNKAGFHHSHKHGFGLMDAWRLVNAAKVWQPVPWLTLYSSKEMRENKDIPPLGNKLVLKYNVDETLLDGYNLFSLEYVHVIVTLSHQQRGDLEIHLVCPSTTKSVLAATRSLDTSKDGFDHWTFSTVRCWGEPPEGTYTLTVQDKGKSRKKRGVFKSWQLKLYGSPMSASDIKRRRELVAAAADGSKLYDNFTLPCPPPPLRNKPMTVITEKKLKVLVLASAFCMLMAIYETLEYMFCYDDEKKKHYEEMEATIRQRQSSQNPSGSGLADSSDPDSRTRSDTEDSLEGTRLLDPENIPLTPLNSGVEFITHNNDGLSSVHSEVHIGTVSPEEENASDRKSTSTFFQSIKNYFTRRPFQYKVLPGDPVRREVNGASGVPDVSDSFSNSEETEALICKERRTSIDDMTQLNDVSSSLINSSKKFILDEFVAENDSSILRGNDALSDEFNISSAVSNSPLEISCRENGIKLSQN